MSHYVNECMHGLVISQCRCPDKNKVIHLVDCPDTPGHDNTVEQEAAVEAPESPVEAPTDPSGAHILPYVICPRCGERKVLYFKYSNEADKHQHTHYVCTFWGTKQGAACGWHGWTVPSHCILGDDS